MKKILFFLTTITILFFISFAPFNDAMAYEGQEDTAFYYNEHGALLWQNPHAAKQESFVIKTRKSFSEIFNDIPQQDTIAGAGFSYAPATVISIKRHTAKKVERLIRRGMIDDPLVKENIMPVLNKAILCRMYDNIQVRCSNNDDRNYQEYGGVLLPDGTITCISGDISDPQTFTGAALLIKEKALVYYHSHPAGYVDRSNNSFYASAELNPNKVFFTGSTQTETITYVQGPSKQDQDAIGKGTGYVFGMSSSSGLIYLYDNEGVKATLPVSFVKTKVRKSESRNVRKIDTYTAGLFSNIHYLF